VTQQILSLVSPLIALSLVVVTTFLPITVHAQAKCENQEEQLKDCEAILIIADVAINKQSDTIAALVQQNDALKLTLETAKPAVEAYGAWHNNKWLWVFVGAISGAYVHREFSR